MIYLRLKASAKILVIDFEHEVIEIKKKRLLKRQALTLLYGSSYSSSQIKVYQFHLLHSTRPAEK